MPPETADDDPALAVFVARAGLGGWQVQPLAGDASARAYARLVPPDGAPARILMDSRQVDPAPFLRIAALLRDGGLAAPQVLAGPEGGLMIVEDLGRTDFASWLALDPGAEEELYLAAVDTMLALQRLPPPPDLTRLNPTRAAGMIGPFFDHVAPGADARTRAAITGALQAALAEHATEATVLSLRDFHAENLIWRPHRTGTDRVGLLDFQDAVIAPPDYDLASLLRDPRRDLRPATARAAVARMAAATGRPLAGVEAAVAVLGAQRNLRIRGIFARLIAVERKTRYAAFLPRLTRLLAEDLAHPALSALGPLVLPLMEHPA
jgi:hypothetical protein